MGKPTTTPITWATDVNYPAGGASWNGTPTKVVPDAGKQASGWSPSEKPAAEHLNYILWLLWLWVGYLANFYSQPQLHAAIDFRDPQLGTGGGGGGVYLWQGDYTVPNPAAGVMFWKFVTPPCAVMSRCTYAVVGFGFAQIDFYVRSFTAGKNVTVKLNRQRIDGTGNMENISEFTHACAGGSGAWEVVSLEPGHNVEDGYWYWLSVNGEDTVDLLQASVTPV